MKKVRTHSFNGTRYDIEECTEIDGIFDSVGQAITILRGNNVTALGSALEEGLHAMGVPDKYLHKTLSKIVVGKSASKVDDLARFLWRLGYRRKK